MPFFPPWDEGEMPSSDEELLEWAMNAYEQGQRDGRKQGARQIVDNVDDFVKRKYFNKDVERGSQFAEDILDLARTLIHQLRHGDLGKPTAEEK